MFCSSSDWELTTEPYAHQRAAVEKLSRLNVGALFMDMGTGKTRTAIELVWLRRKLISKCVWCCPVSLKETVKREILRHTSCRDEDIHVFGSKTRETNIPRVGWHIVGLESLGRAARVFSALGRLIDGGTFLIVDESSYIKGHKAKRTRRLTRLGVRAPYRLILTGTPITQGIEDLYAQMEFLSPRILGCPSWHSFRNMYAALPNDGERVERTENFSEVCRNIVPYVYQISKEECLSLPPKTYRRVICKFSEEQTRLYQAVKSRFLEEMYGTYDPAGMGMAIYRLFSGLHSVSCGVLPAGFSGKKRLKNMRVEQLIELFRKVRTSHIITWVNYRESLAALGEALHAAFPEMPVCRIFGGLSPAVRTAQLDLWRKGGGVLLATQGTGGYGLTLTEADHVFFFSENWKYALRIQAEDRCHRIGQKRSVHYVTLQCECNLDERIRSALSRKADALEELKREIRRLNGDYGTIRKLVEQTV